MGEGAHFSARGDALEDDVEMADRSDRLDRFGKERWETLSPLLDRGFELAEDDRADWLAALRADDAALAGDVEAMLQEHAALRRESFLEASPEVPARAASVIGQTIGAYTVRGLIGEGGMGSVWLAERSDGRFQRPAAVKLLNASLAGRGGEAR